MYNGVVWHLLWFARCNGNCEMTWSKIVIKIISNIGENEEKL